MAHDRIEWACANCGRPALPNQPIFEYGNLLVCAECYRVLVPTYRRMAMDLLAFFRSKPYRIAGLICIVLASLWGIDMSLWRGKSKPEPPTQGYMPPVPTLQPEVSTAAEDDTAYVLVWTDVNHDKSKVTQNLVNLYRVSLRKCAAIYSRDVNAIGSMTLKAHELLAQKGIKQDCLSMMNAMRSIGTDAGQKYEELIAAYCVVRSNGMSHEEAASGLGGLLDAIEANPDLLDDRPATPPRKEPIRR